ncbi:hypothetical protein ACQSSU_20560 [Micromonospora echinospora]
MPIPDVLLLTDSDRRKEEFRVYSDHTGAILHMTADPVVATDCWTSAPLVVVAHDMATVVMNSDLPDRDRCGDVALLTTYPMPLALQAARAVSATFVVHEPIGIAWLLTMMRHAATRGTEARRTLAESRLADI